jgi:hypothetical protein
MTAVGSCCDKGLSCLRLCRYVSTTDELARTPDNHPSFSLRGFACGHDETWRRNHSSPEELAVFTIEFGCARVDAYPGEHKFAVESCFEALISHRSGGSLLMLY